MLPEIAQSHRVPHTFQEVLLTLFSNYDRYIVRGRWIVRYVFIQKYLNCQRYITAFSGQ